MSTVAIVCGLLGPLVVLLAFVVICKPRADLSDRPRSALDPTGQSNLNKIQRNKYDKFHKAGRIIEEEPLPPTAQNTVASSISVPESEASRGAPASSHAVTILM